MMHKLTFFEGSLKGSSVDVVQGREISIGRSRSCEVRPKEDDVSGRHATVSLGADDVLRMNVLSRHETMLNSERVASGTTVKLGLGDVVRFGGACAFVVEGSMSHADDPPTMVGDAIGDPATQIETSAGFVTQMHPIDIDRTVATSKAPIANNAEAGTAAGFTMATRVVMGSADAPSQAGGDGETALLGTLIGSEEDMRRIKREFQIRRRNRFLSWAIPVALSFVGIVAAYIILRPVPEEFVTWPKDENGGFLNRYTLVEPFIAVCVPDVPEFSESRDGAGLHIESAVGRDRDVPLYVNVEVCRNAQILTNSHAAAFRAYLSRRCETDTTFSPGDNPIRRFSNIDVGAGVPRTYVDYTRRSGADEFFGYLVYLRRADREYAFSIEVPIADRWRAERFLMVNLDAFVLYAPKRVPEHWEGTKDIRAKTSASSDLGDAKGYILQDNAPQKWEKGYYCLMSALVKSTEKEEGIIVTNATALLVKLRDRQSQWFNKSKPGYQEAELAGDKASMQSIQATCESVFTQAFQDSDCRYESIKRKEWR